MLSATWNLGGRGGWKQGTSEVEATRVVPVVMMAELARKEIEKGMESEWILKVEV